MRELPPRLANCQEVESGKAALGCCGLRETLRLANPEMLARGYATPRYFDNSPTSLSNLAIAAWIGAGLDMSTPATFSDCSG